MATVTKETDGTFSVSPNGDTAVTLATENTYLDKNIVFNINGGTEIIVDDSAPVSTTKLKIEPEVTQVEVLTADDLQKRCNLNLLDNGCFITPVNQRGQTAYYGSNQYCVDRWYLSGDGAGTYATIQKGYIEYVGYGNSNLAQWIENKYDGMKLTYTILIRNSKNLRMTARYENWVEIASKTIPDNYNGIASITFTVPSGHTGTDSGKRLLFSLCGQTESKENWANVVGMKVELGSQQTLAHEEDGTWVLNEIPDYGEELRRCQRYFVRSDPAGELSGVYPAKRIYSNVFTGAQFPVRMAEIPSVTIINPSTLARGYACYWNSSQNYEAFPGWIGYDRFLMVCPSFSEDIVPLYYAYEATVPGLGS